MCARVWGLFVPSQCCATLCLRNVAKCWVPQVRALQPRWLAGIRPSKPCFPKTLQKKTQMSATWELITRSLKSFDCLKEKGAAAPSVRYAGSGRPPDRSAAMSLLPQLTSPEPAPSGWGRGWSGHPHTWLTRSQAHQPRKDHVLPRIVLGILTVFCYLFKT